MDPMGSILLLLRPWMGYDYIVIQVVCWVELPEQRRLPDFFCKNMDLDKWDTTVSYRVTRNPQEFYRLTGLSTGPPDLGCHRFCVATQSNHVATQLRLLHHSSVAIVSKSVLTELK